MVVEFESDFDSVNKSVGHLKIFFGFSAGVGKTYAMLKAAHREKARGVWLPATLNLICGRKLRLLFRGGKVFL